MTECSACAPGASESDASEQTTWWAAHGQAALTVVSGAATAAGFSLEVALAGVGSAIGGGPGGGVHPGPPWPAMAAYSLAIASGLGLVVPHAWRAARALRPDMNLLMTIAVAGAVVLGEWFEAATVSALFALSLLLESWSVHRAQRAVDKLLSLAPAKVRVRRGDEVVEVDPSAVEVGSVFLVRPGERIALDGVVLEGASDVDQAPITGESLPVAKAPGADVFAGTINGHGALEVRATVPADGTVLAHIVEMVGHARGSKSPTERWVDRFAKVYTPAVFLAALAVMIVPPVAFGGAWADWFYRGLVLLVIGCPCALVISTPVAMVSGLARAARAGVLVKGGAALEVPSTLRGVALDKTGTIPLGEPRVVATISLDGHGPRELVAVAAGIEADSPHPIARSVVAHANDQGIPPRRARKVTVVPGKGATGVVGGESWWLGSHAWLEERGQNTPALRELLVEGSTAGRSAVVVGTGDHVCGVLMLADAVRPDAATAVAALHAAGLRVVMLTGDIAPTAEAIATQVGIDEVHADLLPAAKVAEVERLEGELGPVAMVGDGVNDAPALARASLGGAMGVLGTDVAIETSDVALMTDDLSRLAWLAGYSKRVLSVIRQNIAVALGIKFVFVVLAVLGTASLWGAVAADMGASLLVIFNALRLLGGAEGDAPRPV